MTCLQAISHVIETAAYITQCTSQHCQVECVVYSVKCYSGGRKSPFIPPILDAKVIPLCAIHQALSYENNLTLLAWFLSVIAYLNMLFILEVVSTACSEQLKNK